MAATQKHAKSSQSRHNLPEELLREILSRLPVKSLLRFRCVSKPWLSLVDDDAYFARSHLTTFKNNRDETGLFVYQYMPHEFVVRCSDTFEPILKIPFTLLTDSSRRVISSLHGLILLNFYTNKIGDFFDLKVWNPSLRKLHEIPPLLKPQVSNSSFLVYGEDIGLGYDPVANDYKHVRLIFVNKTLHSVAIYAIGAGSWKTIRFQGDGSPSCSDWHWEMHTNGRVVYFGSSLNFIIRDKRIDRGWDLVRFDLSKEVFSSVSLPWVKPNCYHYWKLLLVDGGSSLVACSRCSSDMYVWAVDSELKCWTKRESYTFRGYDLLHIKKNGDALTYATYGYNCPDEDKVVQWDEMISLSSETGKPKMELQLDTVICHISCYVESLILKR